MMGTRGQDVGCTDQDSWGPDGRDAGGAAAALFDELLLLLLDGEHGAKENRQTTAS